MPDSFWKKPFLGGVDCAEIILKDRVIIQHDGHLVQLNLTKTLY